MPGNPTDWSQVSCRVPEVQRIGESRSRHSAELPSKFSIEDPAKAEHTVLLLDALERRRWTRTRGDDWQLKWSFGQHTADEYATVRADQRLNHFPGTITQHSKDELAVFLDRARALAGSETYDFFPRTFSLPHQYGSWRAAAEDDPTAIWISKPKRGAKGHGVQVVTDIDAVAADPNFIVQQYISSPLVVPEYPNKHVIRIYVAVTSLDPLIAYIHPYTFVRFASRPFGLSPNELADPIRHVTNPSVQLTNPDLKSGIRIMQWVEFADLLGRAGLDAEPLWPRIRTMLTLVLAAHRRPMHTVTERYTERASSCFELLGYDVMIDDQLKPRLIECNMSPLLSLRGAAGSKDRLTHESVKRPVINDLLDLVGVVDGEPFTPRQPIHRFEDEVVRRGAFELLAPNTEVLRTLDSLGDLSPLDEMLWEQSGSAISDPDHRTR